MRRPGCFPGAWSHWHLQVVTSIHFIHIVLFYYFLVSERSGRKPPVERSALYQHMYIAGTTYVEDSAKMKILTASAQPSPTLLVPGSTYYTYYELRARCCDYYIQQYLQLDRGPSAYACTHGMYDGMVLEVMTAAAVL